MRGTDIHEHFKTAAPWVDWENTCDGFKYGNPDAEVNKIAVGWQSLMTSLEDAVRKGCNFFITHEPTFYAHMDDNEELKNTEPGLSKKAFLDEHGITVYRCHDAWDIFPEFGIVDSWSSHLGLGQPVKTEKYYNLHEITPVTAWEFTERVTARVKSLGQRSVEFTGPMHAIIRKVCVGTGAITNFRTMHAMGADLVIVTDDGFSYWRDGSMAQDIGIPFCTVNHATAEIPGMRNMVKYLGGEFPTVETVFAGPECLFTSRNSSNEGGISVKMIRDIPDDFSLPEVPEGLQITPMHADEVHEYLAVMNDSIHAGQADQAWFDQTFGNDPDYIPANIVLIRDSDEIVAGAGAWHTKLDGEMIGMVHYVGVKKSHRNRGLGKLLTAAVLVRLKERGFDQAFLDTQHFRLPAIRAYLKQGFEPSIHTEEDEAVWAAIKQNIAEMERDRP